MPAAAALLLCLISLLARPVQAGEDAAASGYWSLQVENDLTAGSDRHYTNGLRLSWLSGENRVPEVVREAADHIPLFPADSVKRWGLALGHSMFTPENTTTTALVPTERPYAGWLYGSVNVVSDTGQRLDLLELSLGVVGPSALAGEVQNEWHRLIGARPINGWRNQIKDEPGVMLTYVRKQRAWQHFGVAGLGVDVTPHAGVALGNVMTHAAVGVMLRAGQNLPKDYGPPRIRPSLPGSTFFTPQPGLGWYVFAGVEGRAVARNIFLDGNTWRSSHSVSRLPWVGDAQVGAVVTWRDMRVSLTHVLRTREYRGQPEVDRFGSLSLSVRY